MVTQLNICITKKSQCGPKLTGMNACPIDTYNMHYPQNDSHHVHAVSVDFGEMFSKLGWVAIY